MNILPEQGMKTPVQLLYTPLEGRVHVTLRAAITKLRIVNTLCERRAP